MAEYILRDAAIEVALSCADAFEPIAVDITVKNVVWKLRNIPSADVQPVKHGRWELGKSGNDFIGYPVYNCSVCGYWNEDVYGFLYCPNCGARMEGET